MFLLITLRNQSYYNHHFRTHLLSSWIIVLHITSRVSTDCLPLSNINPWTYFSVKMTLMIITSWRALIVRQVVVTLLRRLYNTPSLSFGSGCPIFDMWSVLSWGLLLLFLYPTCIPFLRFSQCFISIAREIGTLPIPYIFRENQIFRGITGFSPKELGISFRSKYLIFRIFVTITCHKYDIIEID